MSHDHRDDHQLADLDVVAAEPVVPVVPAPVVTNNEAEQRAQARRKAEGIPEQTTEHQFTGDLPEPDRGGTDTETRIVFGEDAGSEDEALANPAGTTRRGPPPPRAHHIVDEGSWAVPALIDAHGASGAADRPSWLAARTSGSVSATLGGGDLASWATTARR